MYELRSFSHRLGGARSSHTHRICKDFNNEPLTPNHRDRSGVYKRPVHMQMHPRAVPYKVAAAACWGWKNALASQVTNTADMVKYFSVDWLAQSHRGGAPPQEPKATCRPHVPCMVQPRPPAFGRSCLQPKPKASKSVPHTDLQESGSPAHPAGCASPISEISGYSSGYDSEATSSECLSIDEMEKESQQRRVRTKFTAEQINKLEKIFSEHRYLDARERMRTAKKLGLTETQVRTWFQNRRMKLKREMQDCFAADVPQVMFQPLPLVRYHPGMATQQHRHPAARRAFYPLNVAQMVLQQPPPHPTPQPYFY